MDETIRLYNNDDTLKFVKFFIKIAEEQRNNVIWVGKNNEIIVLARKKVNIEGAKVISLEEEIKNSFLSISGVKKVAINDKIILNIEPNPEIYEKIYVVKFSLEKEYGIKLELEIIEC